MPKQQLRPLQPAKPSSSPNDDDDSSPGPSLSRSVSISRARVAGQVPACETCRKRKKKCDRGRPACVNCTERGLECEYRHGPEPTSSPLQLERLAHIMRDPGALPELFTTLPYHDALELLNMLREVPPDTRSRATTEASTQPSSSPPPRPPPWPSPPSLSQYSIVGSLLPPASSAMELELMVRHPIAYPVLLPVTAGSLPFEELLVPRKSEAFGASLLQDTNPVHHQASPDVSMAQDGAAPTHSYERLSHLTQSHIHLLGQIDISLWIAVPIPNQVAVQAIALYLNNDYPVLPLFDADLFLRDLVHNQPYFCSPFLVAALLAWACQAYTPMHPEAAHYSSACFADAQAQWSQYGDREAITLSSVSALQLLCMTAVTHGKDDLAFKYLRKGLEVAQSMGLLNLAPGTEIAGAWFSGYTEWTRAASYAAWGAFNWISIFSLHYHAAEIEFPPRLFMPGDVDAGTTGEEGGGAVSPTSLEVLKASSKLWTIFGAVTRAYYGKNSNITFDQSNVLEFAEDIYRQLLSWADDLPMSLVRCPGSSHAVFMLHIYYHAIIADLFRPFIHLGNSSAPMLRIFSTDQATPKVVYHASIRQMKRLLLSYRLEFDLQASSVLWQTCIIYVANATVRETESNREEMLFFVHLCLAGLEEMFLSYRVFGSIKKAVLGMAFRQKVLGREDMLRNRRVLETIGQRYTTEGDDEGMDEVMARWMVDLDLALTDPEHAQGGRLAEQFDQMSEPRRDEDEGE